MELTTFIRYGVDKSNLLAFFGPFKITHYHSYLTLEEGPTCSLLAHIFLLHFPLNITNFSVSDTMFITLLHISNFNTFCYENT